MRRISNYLKYFFLRHVKQIKTPARLLRFANRQVGFKPVLWDHNHGTVTFSSIDQNANGVAKYLQELGIIPQSVVSVWMKNCREFVEVRFAAYKANYIFHALLPEFSIDQVIAQCDDTHSKILFLDRTLTPLEWKKLIDAPYPSMIIHINRNHQCLSCISYYEMLKNTTYDEPELSINAQDLSAIGYTSGTTGTPKAVVWSHQAWLQSFYHLLLNSHNPIRKNSVFLHTLPLATAGSLSLLPAFVSGAKNIIIQEFDAEDILNKITKFKVTRLFTAPVFLVDLFDYAVSSEKKYDLSSLQTIHVGSAPLPSAKLAQIIEKWGPIIEQGYGMAEVLAPLSFMKIDNPNKQKHLLNAVGKPIRQIRLSIENSADKNYGKIMLQSKTMAVGYWSKGKPNVFNNRWFTTSDYGMIQNGYLLLKGRESEIVERDGEKFFLKEVEECIYSYPNIKDVCVTNQNDKLIAFIVCSRHCLIEKNELFAHCKKQLSPHMTPDDIVFQPSLPFSSSGKILRHQLIKAEI